MSAWVRTGDWGVVILEDAILIVGCVGSGSFRLKEDGLICILIHGSSAV